MCIRDRFQSLLCLYEPWLDDREYTLTSSYVEKTWRRFVTDNPDKYRLAQPQDWIFTNRLQWGLCGMIGELEARSNWHRQWIALTENDKYREDAHAV